MGKKASCPNCTGSQKLRRPETSFRRWFNRWGVLLVGFVIIKLGFWMFKGPKPQPTPVLPAPVIKVESTIKWDD